jgi:hypothetical protein
MMQLLYTNAELYVIYSKNRSGSEKVDRSTDGRDNSNNFTLERQQVASLRRHQVGRALVAIATEKLLKIRGGQSDGFRLGNLTPRF